MVRLRVGQEHSQSWPILARFMYYYSLFWGLVVISTIDNPGLRLSVGHQQSRFLSILNRLMDYYLPFWRPKAISMVVESQHVITRWSSRLVV